MPCVLDAAKAAGDRFLHYSIQLHVYTSENANMDKGPNRLVSFLHHILHNGSSVRSCDRLGFLPAFATPLEHLGEEADCGSLLNLSGIRQRSSST